MLYLIVAGVLFLDVARKTVDAFARWRHWRVGRLGAFLCIWHREGGGCYRCKTDYRWAVPHDIAIRERYDIFPLCRKCWAETGEQERLVACHALLNDWRNEGRYAGPDGTIRWNADVTDIFMAVKVLTQLEQTA